MFFLRSLVPLNASWLAQDVLKASRSIEAVIGDELPKWMSLEQRQKQVIKMLQEW